MAPQTKFAVFIDWKRELLSSRGLTVPDGRPLYQYRLSLAEFDELEALLQQWLSRLLERVELARLPRLTGFSCLFVLYGSEWWRRRFDGAHWSWEPILQSIGADPKEWTQSQRSECVQVGLQDWARKTRERGALRFLGTVAVEGGLPLKLLANERGHIGQLLSQVLGQAKGGSVTPDQLHNWVLSLQATLPRSYRQEAIYSLLADVAWTVLQLKDEAGLTSSRDAISRLDQQIASWRDRFPLPVEDTHAQGLIEQLIKDVTRDPEKSKARCLPVERHLSHLDDGQWTLQSGVALPANLPAAELVKLFLLQADELPRNGEIAILAGGKRRAAGFRRMAGNDSLRVERSPWGFSGNTAAAEHLLQLAAPDGRRWSVIAPRGEPLDEELPWVFSDEDGSPAFLRQGSGGVAASQVLIAVPEDWRLRPVDGSTATECGRLNTPARRLFRVAGSVEAGNDAGLVCRIRTGQANTSDDSYELKGQRVWLDFESPAMAFKGRPTLYKVDTDGTALRVDGMPSWTVVGAPGYDGTAAIGPLAMRYPANGEVKRRARLLVLPTTANLTITPIDAGGGEIRLEKWLATSARVLTDGIGATLRHDSEDLVLSLATRDGVRPPEHVDLEVLWGHTTKPARLRVPFPGKGVRAFGADGEELCCGSLLAAERIAGIRLVALDGGRNLAMSLEFEAARGNQVRIHRLEQQPGALGVEVRLQDYATDIQHLLSLDDSPDASVRLRLRVGNGESTPFRLDIARYAARLIRSGNDIAIDAAGMAALGTGEMTELPVLALRLQQPGDEPLRLEIRCSEDVPTGTWAFDPESRDGGSWLIYPGSEARFPFRPTLWTLPGVPEAAGPLAQAIGIADPASREGELDQVIAALAVDFQHPCWTEIERLAAQVGHLPLPTIDLWRRFARSPAGMAALAFRFGTLPKGFVDRFDQELPFAWETIPFGAWQQSITCLKEQCDAQFGETGGPAVLRMHLRDRIDELSATNGALNYLLGIVSSDCFPEGPAQVRGLWFLGSTNEHPLLLAPDSAMMQLRQRHVNENWPTPNGRLLDAARQNPQIAHFMCAQQFGEPDGVINMPFLLAAEVVTNSSDHWFGDARSIQHLRDHQAFDPLWFEHAFNETIAQALACDLLIKLDH